MRQYFNVSWCLLLFLSLFSESYAQEVKVSAKLDKTTIALGDQTVLRFAVVGPRASIVTLPLLADTISSKIQIVEIGKPDTLVDKNDPSQHTISRAYTITSFEAGLHMIPAFSFKTKDAELTTEALPLEVTAVQVDTTKAIYDIKQPLAVYYSFADWLRDYWYWIVIGLIVLALLIGLVYYLRKGRIVAPAVQRPKKPAVPLHVATLNKLNELRDKKLWQMDMVKEYHVELTDILREYLEKRYGINALEQTSDEIIANTQHLDIAARDRDQLRQILMLADLVKFAKGSPGTADNEVSMNNAVDFVTATKEITVITEKEKE